MKYKIGTRESYEGKATHCNVSESADIILTKIILNDDCVKEKYREAVLLRRWYRDDITLGELVAQFTEARQRRMIIK